MNKKDFLGILIQLGAIGSSVSVRDLKEYFETELLSGEALGMKLRQLHHQQLVTRSGKGTPNSRYRYELTIKGIKRYDYLHARDG